jgi:hypothetical protein
MREVTMVDLAASFEAGEVVYLAGASGEAMTTLVADVHTTVAEASTGGLSDSHAPSAYMGL